MKKYSFILFSAFIAFACNVNGDNESAKIPSPISDSLLNERWKMIHVVADSIREGDLVLRCGNDLISESLSDFSQKEKLYSHSGVAMMDNGTIPQKHRVGFRYYGKDGGPGGTVSDEIGLDDFDFISQ